ncbi:MAG: hypothetical protein GX028_08910 [Clostridiaceae bacterium]|nr:hypothetical protein [Clostridiaceae bacterium]
MPELMFLVLGPIILAALIYFLPEKLTRPAAIILQLASVAVAIRVFSTVKESGRLIVNIGNWPVSVGITLVADQFTAVMLVLMATMIMLLLLFDISQVSVDRSFLTLFLILEGLLAGVLVSGDLFNIYVLIEIATIVVTLLILFDIKKRSIYDGIFYIMINMTAMTMYLFGLGLLYRLTGTLSTIALSDILAKGYPPKSLILPFSLMASAVSLKAAFFPLVSWLPKAHGSPGAPSSVSALLSGLYVKTGLILLFRLLAIFSLPGSRQFFMAVGIITSFAGIVLALIQTDIKKLLGYSTISQIGLIIAAYSYGSSNSQTGAMLHIVNHALFKSALFLAVGIIVEKYQTRDIRRIRDVWRRMPGVSAAMILGMLGVTGAPFFNGSVSKYLIKADFADGVLKISLLLINLGTVLYFLRISRIFGRSVDPYVTGADMQAASMQKQLANMNIIRTEPVKKLIVLLLGSMCLITGIAGGLLSSYLFDHSLNMSAEVILDNTLTWLMTLAVGAALYRVSARYLHKLQKLRLHEPGFNQVCMALGAYLAVMLIFLLYQNR